MNMVTSKIIGPLKQDDKFPNNWVHEQGVMVPFFDGFKMPVSFLDYDSAVDKDFLQDADLALNNFLNKTAADKYDVTQYTYQNYLKFSQEADNVEFEYQKLELKDEKEIWKFVYPSEICLQRQEKSGDMYVQISCECEWDVEHGLQLIFRQGSLLTRVSTQDGHLDGSGEINNIQK